MIEVNKLCIGYYGRTIELPSITGRFWYGSMTAVLGANGVGKSTFLKTLAGFLPPASGEVKFNSVSGRPKISYLPQRTNINHQFPLTVFDVVAMGCWPEVGLLGKVTKKQKIIILDTLKYLKLYKIHNRDISVLSVGQFQCMLFARLLVQRSPLMFLDEPFNNVDSQTCVNMLSIISQLCRSGSTVIIVLHDTRIVAKYFSSALFLHSQFNKWVSF